MQYFFEVLPVTHQRCVTLESSENRNIFHIIWSRSILSKICFFKFSRLFHCSVIKVRKTTNIRCFHEVVRIKFQCVNGYYCTKYIQSCQHFFSKKYIFLESLYIVILDPLKCKIIRTIVFEYPPGRSSHKFCCNLFPPFPPPEESDCWVSFRAENLPPDTREHYSRPQ